MADTPYGLGAIPSPPDDRDYQIDLDQATPLPATFQVKDAGVPVYDQGQTPMCVAYSGAGEQESFDLPHTFKWDFGYFFRLIGGTSNGAVIRNAFEHRLHHGYPLLPAGSGNSEGAHRISAYYAVPKTQDAIKRALVQHGRLVIGTPWFNSWFTPSSKGNLPPADYQVGGHAVDVDGYDVQGIWLVNSWGAAWGVNGRCHMSWTTALHTVSEIWKAVDAK